MGARLAARQSVGGQTGRAAAGRSGGRVTMATVATPTGRHEADTVRMARSDAVRVIVVDQAAGIIDGVKIMVFGLGVADFAHLGRGRVGDGVVAESTRGGGAFKGNGGDWSEDGRQFGRHPLDVGGRLVMTGGAGEGAVLAAGYPPAVGPFGGTGNLAVVQHRGGGRHLVRLRPSLRHEYARQHGADQHQADFGGPADSRNLLG